MAFDIFTMMADCLKWLLRVIGRLKYNGRYMKQLRAAATAMQTLPYPGD